MTAGRPIWVPRTPDFAGLRAPRSPEDPVAKPDKARREISRCDRTTTRIEDTLTAYGDDVNSEIVYVKLAIEIASNRTSTITLAVVGLLVGAIGMAGLANSLTMSALERTREIGILRSIGARARDMRRIFAAQTSPSPPPDSNAPSPTYSNSVARRTASDQSQSPTNLAQFFCQSAMLVSSASRPCSCQTGSALA